MNFSVSRTLLLTAFIAVGTVGAVARPKRSQLPSKYEWGPTPYEQQGPLRQIRHKMRAPGEPYSGLIGYADTTGRVVIAPRYAAASDFYEGRAVVQEVTNKESRWGVIDTLGRVVVPCVWDDAWVPCDGRIRVQRGREEERRFGYLDLDGREVIPVLYTEAVNFRNGLAAVRREKAGWIDVDGKTALPFEYDRTENFYDGYAIVGQQGKYYMKYGFVDTEGREVIPIRYYSASRFRNGRAVVSRIIDGKERFGQIDRAGNEVLPLEWDFVSSLSEGTVWVGSGEYPDCVYRLLDETGKPVVPYDFYELNESGSFGHASLAIRLADGTLRYGVLSRSGRVILPFRFDRVTIYTEQAEDGRELPWAAIEYQGEAATVLLLKQEEGK